MDVVSGSYPGPYEDAGTFYGFFSLDGLCGFLRARMFLDYTESFLVAFRQQGAKADRFNALGQDLGRAVHLPGARRLR
ncbi:MAG: hypothetical protein M3P85_13425 [Actinomycetota bacterium]|nr:hypothetical protein [Actinomycetota bacterium]